MSAHVEFGGVMGGGAPVYSGLRRAETLTTTTSAQSAAAHAGEYATISAIGAAVFFTVGQDPTALADGTNMRYLADGAIRDIGPLKEGDKIAAIDAA